MKITRMDLADYGSPERLVTEILKVERDIPIPVPIDALALQLGITEITTLEADGFQGGLITNDTKSTGVILVSDKIGHARARFTVGHELAHFLIPTHRPIGSDRFLCSLEHLLASDRKAFDQRMRWEAEANRFSSLMLMPPPVFRKDVNARAEANLNDILALARRYEVSKEALGRAYVEYRNDPVALLVVHDGRLLRSYKRQDAFPFIAVAWGTPVPGGSLLQRKRHDLSVVSEIEETNAAVWLDVTRGRRAPTVFEQVCRQQNGYALILLTIETEESDEDEADDSNWNRRNIAPGYARR